MKKWLIVSDYPEKTGIWNYAIDLYNSLKDDLDIDFLNLYNSKTFSSYPKIWKVLDIWNFYLWFFFWISGKKLQKYLKENNYDYIILAHQWMGYLLPAISKINIEKITVLHDLISYNIYKNNLLHIVFRFFAIRNIVKSDKIVLTSKMTENDFLDLDFKFSWKTKIIHEYIDETKYYKIKEDTINSLLYLKDNYNTIISSVTNWQPHKNDISFLKLASEFPEYLFVKVGYISEECSKYIETSKLNNIKLLNKISLDNLRELYNITDIYVNTSIKEGFWYPPHEALFCWAKLLTTQSVDMQSMNWVYVLDDYYDISEYKKWINILLKQDLDFVNIDDYKVWKFKKEFIEFINS